MTTKQAYFAAGCFWGVEHLFAKLDGVTDAVSGYMGGHIEHPTYQQVCSKRSGHVEAVAITYDDTIISFELLAKFFFEIHDFTQVDGQGPDIGPQYASVAYYATEDEKQTLDDIVQILADKGATVATRIEAAVKFWIAEEYHQDYYATKGTQPYCHFHRPIQWT